MLLAWREMECIAKLRESHSVLSDCYDLREANSSFSAQCLLLYLASMEAII